MFIVEQMNKPQWKKGICKRMEGQWEGARGCQVCFKVEEKRTGLQTVCKGSGVGRKNSMSLQEERPLLTVKMGNTYLFLYEQLLYRRCWNEKE